MEKIDLKCAICKKKFCRPAWKTKNNKSGKFYCSQECSSRRNQIECTCEHCHSKFTRMKCQVKKSKIHFCNDECLRLHHLKARIVKQCKNCNAEFNVVPRDLEQSFCSYECRGKAGRNRVQLLCDWCKQSIEKKPSHVKKTNFCSYSCRSKYHVRRLQLTKRSRGEEVLCKLIETDFPDYTILKNKRSILASGLEIDIFVEEKKLAIELNGPCHYFNIYGEEKLRSVQTRDAIKHAEIQQAGFPFIIIDISTIQGRKLDKFLLDQYNVNIKPILS